MRTAGGSGAACSPASSAEMTVSMAAQVLFFTGALGLGVAVGVLYDIFRILRVRLRLPLLGGILDLLFWLVVTAALFLYTVTAGSGEVRGYLVLAVLGGAAGLFLAAQPVVSLAGLPPGGFSWACVGAGDTTPCASGPPG